MSGIHIEAVKAILKAGAVIGAWRLTCWALQIDRGAEALGAVPALIVLTFLFFRTHDAPPAHSAPITKEP